MKIVLSECDIRKAIVYYMQHTGYVPAQHKDMPAKDLEIKWMNAIKFYQDDSEYPEAHIEI